MLRHAIRIILLFVISTVTFWPVLECEFLVLDDPPYVVENAWVRNGLRWEGIVWAFTEFDTANWHPLTWLSFMLDAQLYGCDPFGFHATNLILHVLNTAVLYGLLCRMVPDQGWSHFAIALLFAIHPLHVESVAWVAERKDLLFALFGFLSMHAYISYVRGSRIGYVTARTTHFANFPAPGLAPGVQRLMRYFSLGTSSCAKAVEPLGQAQGRCKVCRAPYVTALVLFALSLMSKAMLVTFPFLLLVLDYWPLQRSTPNSNASTQSLKGVTHVSAATWRRLVVEKAPFFLLSAASFVIAFAAQKQGRAVATLETFPAAVRVANALLAYGLYLRDTVVPLYLSPNYAHPQMKTSFVNGAIVGTALAVASWALFRCRSRWPAAWTGWCWYVGTLVPVIGIIQLGSQQRADRYTYFPLIGIFWGTVWCLNQLASASARRRWLISATVALGLVGFATASHRQAGYWLNNTTLFQRAVDVEPHNAFAHFALGRGWEGRGDDQRAIIQFRKALELNPKYYIAGAALARQLFYTASGPNKQAQQQQAVDFLHRFVAFAPETYRILGDMQRELGRYDQAIQSYSIAIQMTPTNASLHWSMAICLFGLGKLNEAKPHFEQAVRLDPRNPDLLTEFGRNELAAGRAQFALQLFERVKALNRKKPGLNADLASAHLAIGRQLVDQGEMTAALPSLELAVQLNPESWLAHLVLGAALIGLNQMEPAEDHLRSAVGLNPQSANAHYSLGFILAKSGRNAAALDHLQAATRLRPDYHDAQELLKSLISTKPSRDFRP